MRAVVYDEYGPPEVLRVAVRDGPDHFVPLDRHCVDGDVAIHIDRRYSPEEVPAALACVGEGRALGKVVVEVD